MKIRLAYGKQGLLIDLPDEYHVDVIEPHWIKGLTNQTEAISAALMNPIDSLPLEVLAKKNSHIGIVFSDITRATPYHIILPPLLEELKHVKSENITFFCANGTHRLCTSDELDIILGKDITGKYRIIQNDISKPEMYEYAGTTRRSNRISFHKELMKQDFKILTGFIEPHFFAGFSGGGKAVMTGMAALESIQYNHSIAHLSHSMARWGITDGNPVWEDLTEAAEFASPLFILNVTLNKNKEITGVFAGDLRSAHKSGCQFAKETSMVQVDGHYDVVITTNSGYPLDLNVYQSVKGMSAAAQIVKEGSHIIMAAECWDGIPQGSDYEKILTSVGSVDELTDFIIRNEKILKDTWQIYFQVLIQKRAHVHMYSDKLDDAAIRIALLTPVNNIEKLIDTLMRDLGQEARICVLPEGPQTIPYI